MKRMIVLRKGGDIHRHEIEDCLSDSEVIRSSYIDYEPIYEKTYLHNENMIYDSSWEIVFKGDETHDQIHILAQVENPNIARDILTIAARNLLTPYRDEHCRLNVVVWDKHYFLSVWSLRKELYRLVDSHMEKILGSLNEEGTYDYRIPEEAIQEVYQTLRDPEEKEEYTKDRRRKDSLI